MCQSKKLNRKHNYLRKFFIYLFKFRIISRSMNVEKKTAIDFSKLSVFKKKAKNSHQPRIEYDFHKKSVPELEEHFKTSMTYGLSSSAAKNRLLGDGKNVITSQTTNVFVKLIKYLFGGFCVLLWIPSLIFILVYRPIGDPANPTNLGIGILLIVVIFLQAAFNFFQGIVFYFSIKKSYFVT